MRIPRFISAFAWIWILLFTLGLIGIPLAAVLARGVRGDVAAAMLDPTVLAIAEVTLDQAMWSVLFSLLIGVPLGLWIGSSRSRAAQAFLGLPYGVPTLVAATAWVAWLGKSGLLSQAGWASGWLYSMKAVILAHVFLNAPWVALLVAQARVQIPEEPLQAARVLGAHGWQRFRFVLWPYLRLPVLNAAVQVQALCSMSFALVLILGGGPPVQTLETAIYSKIRYGSLDLSGAVACALWQLIITGVPWAVLGVTGALAGVGKRALPVSTAKLRGGSRKRWNGAPVLAAAFFIAPYLIFLGAIPWGSVVTAEWIGELSRPLLVSLAIAIGASVIGVFTAVCAVVAAESRIGSRAVALLAGIPAGISVLVLGLGFWFAYGNWVDPFEGSLVAIIGIQAALFLPLAFRQLRALARGHQRREFEAALTLGASPWRAFRYVEWPRWSGPLLSVFALVAAASLGEVAAVSLFYSENLVPLPLVVSRWMGQYRFDEAGAVAGVLFVLAMGAVAMTLMVNGGSRRIENEQN